MKLTLAAMLLGAGPLLAASGDVDGDATASAVGSVKGTVVFPGNAPKPKTIKIEKKKAADCKCSTEGIDRSLLVHPDGGVANVVVTVEVPGVSVEPSKVPLIMNNKACRYEPHVLIVPVGSTVEFKNSDSTSHNVHTLPRKNRGINRTVSSGKSVMEVQKRAEAYAAVCDIHPWMKGWVFVTDTPFVALTDARGAFEIPGLPAGKYQAKLWHETLGRSTVEITITAGSVTTIKVPMMAKKKRGRR